LETLARGERWGAERGRHALDEDVDGVEVEIGLERDMGEGEDGEGDKVEAGEGGRAGDVLGEVEVGGVEAGAGGGERRGGMGRGREAEDAEGAGGGGATAEGGEEFGVRGHGKWQIPMYGNIGYRDKKYTKTASTMTTSVRERRRQRARCRTSRRPSDLW